MPTRIIAGLALTTLLLGGCAGSSLQISHTCEAPILVDGIGTEWAGKIQPAEDLPMSLGFQDDGENLYLILVTADMGLQEQILRRGLILWLDGEGGKHKNSGIRYPIGMMETGGLAEMVRRGREREEFDPEKRATRLVEDLDAMKDQLRFLGGKDDPGWTFEHGEIQGMELAYALDAGRLIYEARIPLRAGPERSFSIGASADGEIGVGVEIPAPEMPAGRGGPDGGMSGRGGGMGGGKGGRGGDMGGRGGGMGRPPGGMERPEAIEFWIRVQLSGTP